MLAAMGFASRSAPRSPTSIRHDTAPTVAGRDQRFPAFTAPLPRTAPSEQTVHPSPRWADPLQRRARRPSIRAQRHEPPHDREGGIGRVIRAETMAPLVHEREQFTSHKDEPTPFAFEAGQRRWGERRSIPAVQVGGQMPRQSAAGEHDTV